MTGVEITAVTLISLSFFLAFFNFFPELASGLPKYLSAAYKFITNAYFVLSLFVIGFTILYLFN